MERCRVKRMAKKFRTKLTDIEYNAITKLTMNLHLDENFDVCQCSNGDDCFKDFEDGRLKSLHWGLELLYEGIAYPLKHEYLDNEMCNALAGLFKEFNVGNEEWYKWLLSEEDC